ncbi:hypothetical protein MMPV_010106 [Pyropia vietnamensis]
MAHTADSALPLPVDPTAPPPPAAVADAAATAAPASSSDRPWYKYLFRANFFLGGDDERVAARFAAFRNLDVLARSACSREEVRAFVAADEVYGPRLTADETQATVRGLAGLLSGAAVASSMARRSGSVFPTAILGALLGGLTGNLLADHVASWALGTYKYDPLATHKALHAFVEQRKQRPPSGGGGGSPITSA